MKKLAIAMAITATTTMSLSSDLAGLDRHNQFVDIMAGTNMYGDTLDGNGFSLIAQGQHKISDNLYAFGSLDAGLGSTVNASELRAGAGYRFNNRANIFQNKEFYARGGLQYDMYDDATGHSGIGFYVAVGQQSHTYSWLVTDTSLYIENGGAIAGGIDLKSTIVLNEQFGITGRIAGTRYRSAITAGVRYNY